MLSVCLFIVPIRLIVNSSHETELKMVFLVVVDGLKHHHHITTLNEKKIKKKKGAASSGKVESGCSSCPSVWSLLVTLV